MGAGEEILKRLAVIESKLDRLLASAGPTDASASSSATRSSAGGDALPDGQLDNAWADKEVRKDPPRYQGPSMVGRHYSEVHSEWHDANAGYLDWKAAKGREETPVRLNAKGRPWWESDVFEAKICRAWSRRNAGRLPPGPDEKPVGDAWGATGGGNGLDTDPLPF
jgi:hypothetical protein